MKLLLFCVRVPVDLSDLAPLECTLPILLICARSLYAEIEVSGGARKRARGGEAVKLF